MSTYRQHLPQLTDAVFLTCLLYTSDAADEL